MTSRLVVACLWQTLFAVIAILPGIARAADALAPRIDQLIEADQIGPMAPVASDAEFLRRISLDLTGAIPTAAEARVFLDDPAPNKREALVDRLLAGPRFPIHMATVFDVMLMERRPDKQVPTPEWQRYLQGSFQQNKPYDQLAREILSADGVDPNLRPAAKFLLDRDGEPNLLTRDVGRIFFGMDLQCAQCHDHPLVDHYLQADYYGFYAFFNRTIVFADAAQKKSFLAEKADGVANYKSVFTGDAANTRPKLPGGMEVEEPRFRLGDEYTVAPAKDVRPVPKYSRRTKLAELATNGTNKQFNVNIANRLWAHMMGRGLVHPVDLHHPANPPSHPGVLELVTNEFVAMKYDMRWLLRELALTKTYQRSIDSPADAAPQVQAAAQQVAAVEAEQTRLKGIGEESRKAADAAKEELKAARKALEPVETAWRTAETAVATAKKPTDDAAAAVAKSQADANAKQTALNAINEAAAKVTEAAKLLPNDKEVASAVATLTAKQQQLTGELAALQKTITDQTTAHQATLPKLMEAHTAADAAYAQFVEANKPVDVAKAKLASVWSQHLADATLANVQKKRLETLQAHAQLGTLQAGAVAARGTIEPAKAELAASLQAAEQQQIEVTKQTAAATDIEKSMTEATKALDEAKAAFVVKQGIVLSVAEAVAKSEAALQKLPGDAELTLVVQKLKERHEPLTKEATTLEQTVTARDATAKTVATQLATAKQALAAATTEMTNRQQTVTAKTNAVNQAVAAANASQAAVVTSRESLIDRWTVGFGVRPLKQISPEQMAWAVMQATGIVEPQRAAADAELEKTVPKANVAADPAQAKAREVQLEQLLYEKMRGNTNTFVGLYGGSAGQPPDDFFATADQALFVANGGAVVGWITGGTLAQRLMPLEDPKAFAEELYLSVFTRRPTDAEVAETAQQLTARAAERPAAVRDLMWSLLTSAEFRFNH